MIIIITITLSIVIIIAPNIAINVIKIIKLINKLITKI